ncbi:MAG: branched-chain amino acid ABC transporter permease [SAR324 cluster bacterium]|nr:branched-chain amino acid ABC transporter permease [SAR324 cluster bacterium]
MLLFLGAFLITQNFHNQYYYLAAFTVLQYIILSQGWNILGGYTGYVNFGTGAFFGVGAYTSAMIVKTFKIGKSAPFLELPILFIAGGLVAALLGLGLGYLTMRIKGIYFSISTLALAFVTVTIILNIDALGGATGLYIIRPRKIPFFTNYMEFLFLVMVALSIFAVAFARYIENSWIGRGLSAVRDDEDAAECTGVPVLKLKVFATMASSTLMGVAGAAYPYFVTFLEPISTVSLDVGVNSLAMPLIGGTSTWAGPLVGAVLLGIIQQIALVTLSPEYSLLVIGILLVSFVILAPEGIVGLFRKFRASLKK